MKKIFIFLILLGINFGCKGNTPIIFLHPCNNFSKQEAQKSANILEEYFYNNYKICIKILVDENIKLNNFHKTNNRYYATEIIKYYQNNSKIINIYLLNEDIFTIRKGNKEWGIVGQSFLGGNSCIVSTYRIKNKNNLWKVILHEFCHAYFSCDHCPNDDAKCFMKDAKGHAKFNIQSYFCNSCSKKIKF